MIVGVRPGRRRQVWLLDASVLHLSMRPLAVIHALRTSAQMGRGQRREREHGESVSDVIALFGDGGLNER